MLEQHLAELNTGVALTDAALAALTGRRIPAVFMDPYASGPYVIDAGHW